MSDGDFLGSGWAFPFRISPSGGIALQRHERDIDEAIRIILSTAKGERHMRPQFGCGIHELVFAPNNATTAGLVESYVEEAIGWWEPRVEVLEVNVDTDDDERNLLIITIHYRVRATNDERNLVYPFYLIRSE
ncbi:MAG TPA: GPW/gp25 family protein [Chloroflexia bacterium]|jgi:phage baseplate assembly protein W|nr:GPW/gp25 family protein [Chloroflexia bacterium]